MSIKDGDKYGNEYDKHGHCQFSPLLWVVVGELLLLTGAFAIVASVLSALPFSAMSMGAAIAVSLYCGIMLAMLLIAGIMLYAARTCFGECLKGDQHKKSILATTVLGTKES